MASTHTPSGERELSQEHLDDCHMEPDTIPMSPGYSPVTPSYRFRPSANDVMRDYMISSCRPHEGQSDEVQAESQSTLPKEHLDRRYMAPPTPSRLQTFPPPRPLRTVPPTFQSTPFRPFAQPAYDYPLHTQRSVDDRNAEQAGIRSEVLRTIKDCSLSTPYQGTENEIEMSQRNLAETVLPVVLSGGELANMQEELLSSIKGSDLHMSRREAVWEQERRMKEMAMSSRLIHLVVSLSALATDRFAFDAERAIALEEYYEGKAKRLLRDLEDFQCHHPCARKPVATPTYIADAVVAHGLIKRRLAERKENLRSVINRLEELNQYEHRILDVRDDGELVQRPVGHLLPRRTNQVSGPSNEPRAALDISDSSVGAAQGAAWSFHS